MASEVQPVNPAIRFFQPDPEKPVPYTFAIIVSRYLGKWIWVKHRDRDTWELPAGHVEPGESAEEAARRELFEETGALEYAIQPVVSYEGILNGQPVFGAIYLAQVTKIGPLPESEIAEICLVERLPDHLTYPGIQPQFYHYVLGQTGYSL